MNVPEAAPASLRDRLETLAAQDRALKACLRGQADGIQACADALEGVLDAPECLP